MQGPAANTSWLSSRVWARSSDALAHRSRPSMSTSMTPAASASNRLLAAWTAWCRVAVRSWSGCRSVRVPMLLASIEGSIGMGMPLVPVAELANPVNRPDMTALGCRSGSTAPRGRVGVHRFLRQHDGNQPGQHSPSPAAGHLGGWLVGCRARLGVAAPAANLSRRTGTGSPERADRDPVCLCQLAGAALATRTLQGATGRGPSEVRPSRAPADPTSENDRPCPGDDRPSALCWQL